MRLQRLSDHRRMLWTNGLGVTLEVVAVPADDDWDWRLSIAEVVENGSFSPLPGVDRALVVAVGNGMVLRLGHGSDVRTMAVNLHEAIEFPGDVETRSELVDGGVRDLNFMVRRGREVGRPILTVQHFAAEVVILPGDAVAMVVLDGEVLSKDRNMAEERALRFDAFLREGSPSIRMRADSMTPEQLRTTATKYWASVPSVVAFARFRDL